VEGFLSLASTALTQLAGSGRGPGPLQYFGAAACIIVGSSAFVATIGCLIAALWVATPPEWGPAAPALLSAAALALLCGAIALVIQALLRRSSPPPARDTLMELVKHPDLLSLLRNHVGELLLAAAVAGLISGSTAGRPSRDTKRRP
jgi:hypothetical protein